MKSRLPKNPFGGLSIQALKSASLKHITCTPTKYMMISDVPATELDSSASPYISNLIWRDGALGKRPGLTQIGSAVNGIVLGGGTFYLRNGSAYTIAITKNKVYYYSAGVWTEISGSGASLTSDDYHPFSFCVWPFTERFCFSQGVDTVKYIPSDVSNYLTLSANAPASFVIRSFNNRLNLFKTVESGDTKAQRHRYCINGDITDWTGVGSGYKDLNDQDDYIVNALRLGSSMFVYKERSVTRIVPTGYAATPFQYDQSWSMNRGLLASRSLVSDGSRHFGLFNDGVFSYDGSQFKNIGFGRVDKTILDNINTNRLVMAVGHYINSMESYILGIPGGSADSASVFYLYHLPTDSWTSLSFYQNVGTTFDYLTTSGVTIDSLVGAISAQTYSFDSAFSQIHSGLYLLGLADGSICNLDSSSVDDDGTAISLEWQSKDFKTDGPNIISFAGVEIEYQDFGSATIRVEYSTNGGLSWTTGQNIFVNGNSDGATKTAWSWFVVSGARIRFRIRNINTGENIRITSIRLLVADSGAEY